MYGDGDAAKSKDIAANYITQGCVGIFGANEGSTVGTGNAIQEAGQTVIGVGFDKSDTILNLIKNGYILCTMAQNPDVMGYEGIQSAVKALKGEDVGEEFIDTGVSGRIAVEQLVDRSDTVYHKRRFRVPELFTIFAVEISLIRNL